MDKGMTQVQDLFHEWIVEGITAEEVWSFLTQILTQIDSQWVESLISPKKKVLML